MLRHGYAQTLQQLLQLMTYREIGRRVSYRTVMHMQAKSLARAFDGDHDYHPVLWK